MHSIDTVTSIDHSSILTIGLPSPVRDWLEPQIDTQMQVENNYEKANIEIDIGFFYYSRFAKYTQSIPIDEYQEVLA